MFRLLMFLAVFLYATIPIANADQYWVSYEGNDFPENEGWTRTFSDADGIFGQGGAVRTLEDGALVLDSREDVSIVDFYNMERRVDPGPGETFIMRWRVRIDDIPSSFPFDPVAGVFSDGFGAVHFEFAQDGVQSTFEPGNAATFTAGVFHTFEFISRDMLAYELFLDGELLLGGAFIPVFEASRVSWGDGIRGGASLSTWDYFEFGVVPEPTSAYLVALLSFVAHRRYSNRS